MKWPSRTIGWLAVLVLACNAPALTAQVVAATATAPATLASAAAATQTTAPVQTASSTAAAVPTATWVMQGPKAATVPILLYHRIAISPINSRYYVTPANFEAQIQLLHGWEYQAISTGMLVRALTQGAELPPRPVIITFDDGHLDNYTAAFPIMQKYGFTGILYLVSNYLGVDEYLDVEQVQQMHQAGWEVGSHSIHHLDITRLKPDAQRQEVVDSRKRLEAALGIPVETFAYPFGEYNRAAIGYVKFAGYSAGMNATGYTADQYSNNLYALQRLEVKGQDDLNSFVRLLPWHGDPVFLAGVSSSGVTIPTDTPAP